jgi:tRNA threonylcarbamoyladenosine biosynthesis protein TsaB
MKLLAIDTATESCTAALLIDGCIRERYEVAPRGHAGLILPMVDSLLTEAGLAATDLDGLVLGQGPGSFTGVRIGAGVVQGIAFAADLPVAPVSTLAAMAQGAVRLLGARSVLVAIDARMEEVYWGCYQLGTQALVQAVCAERVLAPDAVTAPTAGTWVGVGSGWERYAPQLEAAVGKRAVEIVSRFYPHAQDLARLGAQVLLDGGGVAADRALPVYLRDRVAS